MAKNTPAQCQRLRSKFVSLRTQFKSARSRKERGDIVESADDIEDRAVRLRCSWAQRIDGWDIKRR